MPDLIESATAILTASDLTLQSSARNVANASTPGFKREVSFSHAIAQCDGDNYCNKNEILQFDYTQGQLRETGQPLDLAIVGPAMFQLREGDALVYARGGVFALAEGGKIADPAGRILQQAGGGDLVLSGNSVEILEDGTVLEDGLPTARLALFEASGPDTWRAASGSNFLAEAGAIEDAARSSVRQGFIEKSNVITSDEMLSMMSAIRSAEVGGKLAQFYDQLMGQAISTFTGNSR